MLLIGCGLFTEDPRSGSPNLKKKPFSTIVCIVDFVAKHGSEMRLPLFFPRAGEIPPFDANLILGYDLHAGFFVMVSGVHLRLWWREVKRSGVEWRE